MYYKCCDCDIMTDDAWINLETDVQHESDWWTRYPTSTQLGIVKQANLNIVMSRKRAIRHCERYSSSTASEWIKNNSELISNAYVHGMGINNSRHSESQKPKIPQRFWNSSTQN